MTFDEFRTAHPTVIQYDKAGIEGIDFFALHACIEKSRYLKSRRSFVFMVKHYAEILAGRYDDFTLEPKRETIGTEDTETAEIKEHIAWLKGLKFNSEQIQMLKNRKGITVSDAIIPLQMALVDGKRNIAAKREGLDFYNRVKEFVNGR